MITLAERRRFWDKVDRNADCWVWTGAHVEFGYGTMRVGGTDKRTHRIVWEMVHGTIPENMFVLHKCDNPPCVNPEHLFLGTKKENTQDMMQKGRLRFAQSRKGDAGTGAKLTNEQVLEIRRCYADKEKNQYELAAMFGVTQTAIGYIVRRKTWTHI